MSKLLIVDGNSIINRAFYAIKYLTAKDGLNTNGIYGFLNILLKNLEEEKPDFVVVAFDVKGPTFRHEQYDLYKAQRKGMPEELAEQMPVLKDVLSAMNISILELPGYEADDIIGTVSKRCENEGVLCRILTGDKDDLQLATDKTSVLLTVTAKGQTTTTIHSSQGVLDKYGVSPLQLIDVKGLMGDSSDNVPGVAGVGEKTALSLIQKYGSIEGIYEHIDDGEIKGALLTKLKSDTEIAYLSKKLVTIDKNVPLDFKIENFSIKPYNNEDLLNILNRLEFKSIIKKLNLDSPVTVTLSPDKEIFDENIASKIKDLGQLYYYINVCENEILCALDSKVYSLPENFSLLKDIFENKSIKKIGHNIKDDIVWLFSKGINYEGLGFDVAIAAYLLDPARSNYDLKMLSSEYLGKEPSITGLPEVLSPLEETLSNILAENEQLDLYFKIELPLVKILADMQVLGFKADKEMLHEFSQNLDLKIKALESNIYELAGEVFNINSPKQLGVILFEKLDLPAVKKTKTGYSTDVDVLMKLSGKHEIIDNLLQYRHLAKLKSTYADGLFAVINPETGKIHSSFNQTVTTTGRISSTEPNLQNIPIRTELGRELRKVFIASSEDYLLVDADYSQIELRVLAHISDDPKMKEAFTSELDIHTQTAAQVFGVAEFMVTPEMRSRAKAVNFGIVYGISDFSLAQDIGTTRKVAKDYIDSYLNTFSNVREYMNNTKEFAKQNGYVKTILNRRRYIPEIASSNFNTRSFGERIAMNAPIQGSAADIIKIAMVKVYEKLKERAPKSRLILQVHDELIVEAHKSELEIVQEILKYEMENAYTLSVPLTVELSTGFSWYDTK